MTPEEQRELVFDHLRRRDEIAAETRHQLAERVHQDELDPMARIDPSVREAVEDEYYGAMGKRRYKTSDGRTLFLTPEEIAQRRRARSQRAKRPSRYYGPGSDDARRAWLTWGFNIGAVLLALVIVALILH